MPTRPVAALVAALLLAGAATASTSAAGLGRGAAPPVVGAAGIGDPYFPEDGNGGIDVVSYEVRDAYRFGDRRLRGTTTVTLTTTEALRSFDLDLLLPVRWVRLSTGPATFSRPDRHELRIHPTAPLAAGTTLRATIAYGGHPGRVGWDGERSWLAERHEVVAMNEPHMAPWWFPANDHPADKASVDVRITVPRGNRVIANGRLAAVRKHGDHTTYHWNGGGPMATYLAFFAAGHFAVRRGVHDGLPWYVAVSKQLSDANRRIAMTTLLRTPEIVSWLQHVLGRYPFHETGGLITALEPGFALENQTRPTYPSWVGQLTVVHELAHQWFGDSVSLRRWRDVWLNEGFATFMEKLWTEDHGGQHAQTWLRRSYAELPKDDSFWTRGVVDPGRRHLFDWSVYQRGAMTLQALRHLVGHATFSRILRHWVAEHRLGHGTTAGFEYLAERLSDRDLTSFFDVWLRHPNKPEDIAANGL